MTRDSRLKGVRFESLLKRFGRFVILPAAALIAIGLAVHSNVTHAADPKAGDAVEVFFLGQWRQGTVVATNARGEVQADFKWGTFDKRDVFKKTEVRMAYEAGALSPLRFWTDTTGKFRIQAVPLALDAENVTLRKPDMSEVKVPVASLSDGDKRFLKTLESKVAAGPAQPPPRPSVETFATVQATGVSDGFAQRVALDANPIPAYLKLKQGGVAFAMEDFFDRMGAVFPVGGADGWLLAAVENGRPSGEIPTKVKWVSLERQKVEGQQMLLPEEIVMDYHAPSHRLLTYGKEKSGNSGWGTTVLSIWEVLPTDKQIKHIVRWNAHAERRGGADEPWARLIDGNTVIQRYTDHEIVVWDVANKQMRYRTTQESFFAPPPTLSGGRKYLFIPEDKQVRILESATGRLACSLPVSDGASAVAISDDGRRAAVLGRSTLTVWDLTDAAAEPQTFQAEAIGTPFEASLAWVGSQRVMADAGRGSLVLFSLEHKLTLWNYEFDLGAVSEGRGRRVREIVDNHLVYAAGVQSGSQRGLAVGAVKLPGPRVDEAAAALNRDELMVLKPGSEVALNVQSDEDGPEIQAALARKIAANGWKLNPNAAAVITAEMKRGESQTITYRSFGGGAEETATVTPYISTLKIQIGENVAWQSGTSTGAPPVVRLNQGESAQEQVDKWQRPDVNFFERTSIPDRILDPTKHSGLGTTYVTNRGLVTDRPAAFEVDE